jgi:hypothetical protein
MKNTLKKMSNKVSKTLKKMRNKVSKTMKNNKNDKIMNEKIEKCKKTYCKKRLDKLILMWNNPEKSNNVEFEKYLKSTYNERRKDSINREKERCPLEHCNPTCKDTFLEPGKFSKTYLKTLGTPFAREGYKELRQKTFGNKKNVLKNGFYEKIPIEIIEKGKKLGAISSCDYATNPFSSD